VTWVDPSLVAEIAFTEWTRERQVAAPTLSRLATRQATTRGDSCADAVRALPAGPVAAPLEWAELSRLADAQPYTIKTIAVDWGKG
jgi:hypothetical protein